MMTSDDLGCGYCGRPLDACDCGIDQELVYRPLRDAPQPKYESPGWGDMVGLPFFSQRRKKPQMDNDIECGHCGELLDKCSCGVDREIRYRDRYLLQTRSDYSAFWILAGVVSVLLVLRALFIGWV